MMSNTTPTVTSVEMQYSLDEILETLVVREITKELDSQIINEMVKLVNDPGYTPQPNSTRMVFDTPEAEAAWKREYNKVLNRDIDADLRELGIESDHK